MSRSPPRDAWLAVFIAIAFIRDNPLLSGIRLYAIMMVAVGADAECGQQIWVEQRPRESIRRDIWRGGSIIRHVAIELVYVNAGLRAVGEYFGFQLIARYLAARLFGYCLIDGVAEYGAVASDVLGDIAKPFAHHIVCVALCGVFVEEIDHIYDGPCLANAVYASDTLL